MRFRLAVTVAIATAAMVSAGCSSSPSAPKSAAATSIQSFTIGTTFGLAASTSAGRFAAYSRLLRLIATDVLYIPLFLPDYSIALSSKYKFAGYNQFSISDSLPYALSIRPASP